MGTPPALSLSGVACRRLFRRRLDRLYTSASQGPSNLTVVSEGPYHRSMVAFPSRGGTRSLPPGPCSSPWHAVTKRAGGVSGHEGSPGQDGEEQHAELHRPASQADMIRAVPESHFDPFSLYEQEIILAY
ncbi:unnamed protein product [Pleuronectes platessa]|uniref:Uncharacterized protein n=1 Tax=Pleuronectes platessa TaxID=8262 RepID=A0A9N7VTY8_PLEPL|nr:unnamed protein product [Pleuronectes platessa]